MSTKKSKTVNEVNTNVVVEPVVEETQVTAPKKTKVAKSSIGIVKGCTDLNVRDKASLDGMAICQIKEGNEVTIDMAASTSEWYKIKTNAGIEGFCMKEFIEVK